MTPERFAEIKAAAGKLTYEPTKKAADELIAEVERMAISPKVQRLIVSSLIGRRAQLENTLTDCADENVLSDLENEIAFIKTTIQWVRGLPAAVPS